VPPPAATTAEASPEAAPTPASPSTPGDETTARSSATTEPGLVTGTRSKGAFSPPRNLAPVFLLGGAAILAYGGTGLLLSFKGQAQTKADQIPPLLGKSMCPATQSASMALQQLCQDLSTDNGQVNDDALWANVLLAIGITTTAAAIVYWFAAEKGDDGHTAQLPVVAPIIGPGLGGVSFSGRF
jgi:hypothetical protein